LHLSLLWLGVLVLPLASHAQMTVDVTSVTETAEAESVVKCSQSEEALNSVCTIFGHLSTACKETKKEHSRAGCAILGESKSGCSPDNNVDTETTQVCNAAKTVCNVKTKDYCTTSIHVACLKTIGALCPEGMSREEAKLKSKFESAEKAQAENTTVPESVIDTLPPASGAAVKAALEAGRNGTEVGKNGTDPVTPAAMSEVEVNASNHTEVEAGRNATVASRAQS